MKKSSLLFILFAGMPFLSQAQEAAALDMYRVEIILTVALVICLLALGALVVALSAMRSMLRARQEELGVDPATQTVIEVRPGEEQVGFWGRFWNRVNVSVPIAHEKDVATDHEYDGIRELDNRLPPWWLYGFYFTIAFGVVYLLYFHVLGTGLSQEEEYAQEMQAAEEAIQAYLANSSTETIDENNVELLTETAALDKGQVIFQANCAVCHGQQGEGGVGPNMVDKYWIHGGDLKSIFSTVKYGAANGMLPWQSKLTAKEIQQVSSYVYSLEGSNPPNQKDPQGELFEREIPETEDSSDSTEVVTATASLIP